MCPVHGGQALIFEAFVIRFAEFFHRVIIESLLFRTDTIKARVEEREKRVNDLLSCFAAMSVV